MSSSGTVPAPASPPSVPFSADDAELRRCVPLFREHGFVRIDGVFSAEEMDPLRRAMDAIVAGLDPAEHPRTTFNTSDEQKHVSDRYFLDSVDKIRFFYEEGAVDGEGKLVVPKERALNKVGHALHWLDPAFRKFTFHERIKRIVRLLGAREPRVTQSMYIFKQPKIGGPTNEHVDATFLHTEQPDALLGVWVAVDPAREDNGCLWFVPGSHKDPACLSATKQYKFVRNISASSSGDPLLKFTGTRPSFEGQGHRFVPVECPSGSVVLIHGLVVHKSEPNRSERPRHAYTYHLVDFAGESKGWNSTNWLQETEIYAFPGLFEHLENGRSN